MTKPSFRRPYLSLMLPIVLAACAGGGNVSSEQSFFKVPELAAFDTTAANVKKHDDSDKYSTLSTNGGGIEKYVVTTKEKSSWSDNYYDAKTDVTVYRTPEGKYYQFGKFNRPILPDYSTPNKAVRTAHEMQPTAGGGKIFICCEGTNTYIPALNSRETMYFGAWVSPQGQNSLFVGGKLADAAYMQGGAEAGGAKGKATYDVWGIRVKNGKVVSSSYTPKNPNNDTAPTLSSKLTVNFNTGKLGGEIIGNNDFGDSVIMQDVNVNGNRFSGTAVSGGVAGKVDGAFYGEHSKSYWTGAISEYGGKSIGGTVQFNGNPTLDTAFGGTRQAVDAATTSTDLTPLTK